MERPGEYISEFESATGTYFRGPRFCVYSYIQGKTEPLVEYEGGLWIPQRPGSARARLYIYIGSDANDANSAAPGVSPAAQQQIDRASPNGAVQTAVGAGIGQGIVATLANIDRGKIAFLADAPPEMNILEAVTAK